MGLGAVRNVLYSEARDRVDRLRSQVRDGIDPIAARKVERESEKNKQAQEIPRFEEVAARYIVAHEAEWSYKHWQQWENTLRAHAFPTIGKQKVDQITAKDVHRCLEPIWQSKLETATRVRSRIEAVLGWAEAHGFRSGVNLARWRGGPLQYMMAAPSRIAKVEHQEALSYQYLPEFMTRLMTLETEGERALGFLILTAARTGEVRGAVWDEVDFGNRIWTVPAERMKAGRMHHVPLSDAIIAILNSRPREGRYIFGGRKPLAKNRMLAVTRSLHPTATPHGFRSSFRDWAAEQVAPREVAEMALAHKVGSKVERAYMRTDLIDQRRALLSNWARFCTGEQG